MLNFPTLPLDTALLPSSVIVPGTAAYLTPLPCPPRPTQIKGLNTNGVICVAVTPNRKWVVGGSRHGTLRVWDLSTGALKHVLKV